MKDRKWGRVIFMTSTAGFIGTFGQINYAAAKTGMLGFSRHIALEMNRYNVTSNCIAPFAWTRIPASVAAPTEDAKEAVERLFKKMTPEDISPLAVYLASEDSKDITGQLFGVRGKEIYIFNQPRIVRSIHKAGGWTAEEIGKTLEQTFAPHFTPLDNSATYFTWEALV
jgi:NAD(P)-dependent dehydrogenase (short-subunit alcohol dehydrogenase family)